MLLPFAFSFHLLSIYDRFGEFFSYYLLRSLNKKLVIHPRDMITFISQMPVIIVGDAFISNQINKGADTKKAEGDEVKAT